MIVELMPMEWLERDNLMTYLCLSNSKMFLSNINYGSVDVSNRCHDETTFAVGFE